MKLIDEQALKKLIILIKNNYRTIKNSYSNTESDILFITKEKHQKDLENYSTKQDLSTVEAIAKGRATGYVFDTKADLDAWLLVAENKAKLNLGDNLYIRAIEVPDYWWDGNNIQQLETQKVNLTNYIKKDGTASQFIKGDGSFDSNVYATETYVNNHTPTLDYATNTDVDNIFNS